MPLYQRTYRCENCGLVMDRDENSAVNHAPAVLCPAPVHTRVIPCGVRLCSPQLTTSDHVSEGRNEERRKKCAMTDEDALAVVLAWQEAANSQDSDRMIALSDTNIEIVGPRGSGVGHQLLRDWMARAGLALKTLRAFARADWVVLEQQGIWHSPQTGEVIGDKTLASTFQVKQALVRRFARHDRLEEALEAAGLDYSDERSLTMSGTQTP